MRHIKTILAAGVIAAAIAYPAIAIDISGAGATFPYPIYAKWADAYKKETGNGLNYQSIGSGGGIKQITAKTVTFGASDMPLKPDELEKDGLVQFPTVMGGVVPVVNLEGIKPGELKLDGRRWPRSSSARSRAGTIRRSRSSTRRPKLPAQAIVVVHRSDGSGTTFIFTDYLSKVSADWKSKVGANTAVEWPVGIGAKGNEGVANNVAKTKGSIGYVEYAYAKQNKLTTTNMINKDGKAVSPTSESFHVGRRRRRLGEGARLLRDPDRLSRRHQPGRSPAPTFILIHKQPQDPAAAAEALKFFAWAYAKGGKMAEDLDYVPMPDKAVVTRSRPSGRTTSRTTPASQSSDRARQMGKGAHWRLFLIHRKKRRLAAAGRGFEWAPEKTRQGAFGMQPAGEASVVDLALQGGTVRARRPPRAPRRWRGCRLGDAGVSVPSDARRGDRGSAHSQRRHPVALVIGSLPALRQFGFGFLVSERWNPVTEKFGALAPIYGTVVTSLIAMLIAVPIGSDDRDVPHRALPAMAAAPDRHRHRAAGRHSQHHLRHLGPVRVRAVPAGHAAAVPDRAVRRRAGPVLAVRRPALRHRHADRRPDPRHHGAAVHHLDLARRVRGGAAGAQGGRLRRRLHHLGGGALRRAALHAGRRHRRRHAGARPRARRDHGGDLRHRQRAQDLGLAAGARHHHLGHHRQRIHRSRRRPLHLVADRARPHPVRHHLHRARRGAL